MIKLNDSIRFVKGVGPKKVKLLAKLGIETVRDAVYYKPRDWEFVPNVTAMDDARADDKTMYLFRGVLSDVEYVHTNGQKRITCRLTSGGHKTIRITFFNRFGGVPCGGMYVYGKVSTYRGSRQMVNPSLYGVNDDLSEVAGSVYPASKGMPSTTIKAIIRKCLNEVTVADIVPAEFAIGFEQSMLEILHFPHDREQLKLALKHFKMKELLLWQLAIAKRRQNNTVRHDAKECCIPFIDQLMIKQKFGFGLTDSQSDAMANIREDMGNRTPMNRLVVGDVGSGKTAVAFYAMQLAAMSNGGQSVMILPTAVLALQQYGALVDLVGTDKVVLIAGSSKPSASTLHCIATGKIQYIVGTTAVQFADLGYKDLRLIVFDEQHKFGMNQRRIAGHSPHVLTMTATPIPRTLLVSALGDMDHSRLEPWVEPDRETWTTDELASVEYEIRETVNRGEQVYIVCSNVEDLEKWSEYLNSLANPWCTCIAHGQMTKGRCEDTLDDFKSGRIDVLCCTTVIEVGLHVENATLMVVTDPDRFGLAQLHQLRGRVGRSGHKGYCLLYTCEEDVSDGAWDRLKQFCACDCGEEIAQLDLKLRGPGAIFGTEQHGIPDLEYADIISDYSLLVEMKGRAETLLRRDPGLKKIGHLMLNSWFTAKITDTDNFFAN